eukprot:SAG22_NODE_3121_length_1922_cov_1.937466_1_plen_441_part_00
MPAAAARRAAEVLAELGFGTALDLELLGGGEAAAEVLAELKAGGLRSADRAKVRLLVGDREHLWRLLSLRERPLAADHGPAWSTDTTDSRPDEDSSAGGRDSTTHRRKLQSDGGVSMDTIAIVLSVLVGTAGYVVQAHTARRSERAQEERAVKQHTAEQARQREHQMMTAQIQRTHQALDQCCRPVQNDVMSMAFARVALVQEIVVKLEASHPDTVAEMVSLATVAEIQPDGSLRSKSSGNLMWIPNPPPELTCAVGKHDLAAPSATSCAISTHDYMSVWSKPYCLELPNGIIAIIAAEPTGEVAGMYRSYVRHTMMPLFRQVSDMLRDYAAYVELPPKDWLEKTFPEMSWRNFTHSIFVQHWVSYALSFERILSEWSDGIFGSIRPGFVQPMGSMLRTLAWTHERAEVKQGELIGMTSVAEFDGQLFSRIESEAKVETV